MSLSIMKSYQGKRTRRELPCRTFLGASSRRIRGTFCVDFVLYLDLEIRIVFEKRSRRGTDRAECEVVVEVEVDLFGLAAVLIFLIVAMLLRNVRTVR